ncbi:MAG: GNAT family N-acetyltransferase [Burkholderiaceae bacterium]
MPAPLPTAISHGLGLVAHREKRALSTHWATGPDEVREAQQLRHLVFVQEMGARLAAYADTPDDVDADRFDQYCDHLLVRASRPNDPGRRMVVGTYRLLPPDGAREAGGLYMDTEFDLAPLAAVRGRTVELGRSCVHPAWRSGGVITALWSALAQYMLSHDVDTMIGCASVSIADGGAAAERLWHRLRASHLVAPHLQVQPHFPLGGPWFRTLDPQYRDTTPEPACAIPPLIKGYLRCGACLLGPPALDRAFRTADLPLMLRIGDLAPRYRRHFFEP